MKSFLQCPITLPSSIAQHFFTSLFLCTAILTISKYFHYLSHLANSGCVKGPIIRKSCEYWHSFNFCLYPQSKDRGHKSHDHWFLIAKAQKIDVLQIFVSDENVCNRNRKPSNPPSPVPSVYCHYLHTLLITSQELTFPNKPVA